MTRLLKLKQFTLSPRLVMLLSFAGTSVVNYIFGVAIGWLLIPGDLGLIGFSQTVILICSLFLNSGLAWSLTTQIAETPTNDRPALVRGFMIVNLLLAAIISILVILLFVSGFLTTGLESWSIVWLIILNLPFLSIIAIEYGAVRGTEAFGSLALIKVLEVVVKAIVGIGLVMLGYGAIGALMGFLVGSFVAAIVGIWLLQINLKMSIMGAIIYPSLRLAGSMFGALFGMAIILNLDILFVKSLTTNGRETAGFYQSAILLANTPYYMTTAMLSVLFPQLARQNDIKLSLLPVLSTLRIILVFFIPFEIVLYIAADQILGLVFPAVYQNATGILQILALGNIALILTALLATIFEASKLARIPAIVLLSTVVVEFISLYLVVPRFGAQGAATIFGLACTISMLIQLVIYLRYIPSPSWHHASAWSLRYIGALVLAVAVYFGGMTLIKQFIFSAILAGIAYLMVAIVTGLIPIPKLSVGK